MNLLPMRLHQLRKDANETQEQVAKLLNVRRTTLSEYEKGNIMPPLDKLRILANHYGVSIDYLTGRTNFKQPEEDDPKDLFKMFLHLSDDLEHNQLYWKGNPINAEIRELLLKYIQNLIDVGNLSIHLEQLEQS